MSRTIELAQKPDQTFFDEPGWVVSLALAILQEAQSTTSNKKEYEMKIITNNALIGFGILVGMLFSTLFYGWMISPIEEKGIMNIIVNALLKTGGILFIFYVLLFNRCTLVQRYCAEMRIPAKDVPSVHREILITEFLVPALVLVALMAIHVAVVKIFF